MFFQFVLADLNNYSILFTFFIIAISLLVISKLRKSSNKLNQSEEQIHFINHQNISTNGTTTPSPLTNMVRKSERRYSTALVKSITVHTCVGIYDELKKIQPEFYQTAPSDGLDLTVSYVDTLLDHDESWFQRTIVCIHGLPGRYTDFDKLVGFYRNTRVRVIVPNLPDFSHTRKTGAFWHTSKEKSTFVKDFLSKLNVNTIDCLISHSFGVQTIAAIWEDPGNLEIKSVALWAPQPLFDTNVNFKQMKKAFRFKSEWWYNMLSYLKAHKNRSIPLRLENVNELLQLCAIVVEFNYENLGQDMNRRIDILIKKNIPVVLLYGSLERLISKNAQYKMNEKLMIKQEDIVIIDPDCDDIKQNLDKILKLKNKFNSFIIKNGGHFCHCNYPEIANKLIDNLLNYYQPYDQQQDDDDEDIEDEDDENELNQDIEIENQND